MAEAELCLSIDLGSGGPKVALVTLDGEILAHEVHHVRTLFGDDGAATQDANEWWLLILGSAKRLLDEPGVSRSQVKIIAVTGMYASTVPVDANARPTGPCLTWLDTRGGWYARRAVGGPFLGYNPRKVLALVRKTGGAPSTAGDDPVGQILYLQHECPEIVAATRWYMEPVDYLTMRFTGVPTATHASRLAWWLTDNRHLDQYRYDEGLVAMMGLDQTKLPPLVPFGSIVGYVTGDVASELGLSSDVAVVTGIPDLHAAALGAGATALYDTHLALSTTSWISCPVPKKKTALAATSPPGAHGVLFTPWLAGERSPVDNKKIRAGFTNLAVTTTTADLVRAVMEGVCAIGAWLFGPVEKFTGRRLGPLRLLGGGAQSTLWCQLYADVLERDVEQVPQPLLAQLRGAAMLAFAALGRRGLGEHTRQGPMFHPSEASVFYRESSERLATLYRRDRDWSRRLSKVAKS